jgi:hypothetical protein
MPDVNREGLTRTVDCKDRGNPTKAVSNTGVGDASRVAPGASIPEPKHIECLATGMNPELKKSNANRATFE